MAHGENTLKVVVPDTATTTTGCFSCQRVCRKFSKGTKWTIEITADTRDLGSAHTFTKRAYERGIVLIQCPSCKNRHLIADNLGWFKDDTQDGRLRNIEDILRVRGEHVQRGTLDADGVVEFS